MVQWYNGTYNTTPSSSSSVPRCRVSPICCRFLQATQKKAWRHFHNRDVDDVGDGDGDDDDDDDDDDGGGDGGD